MVENWTFRKCPTRLERRIEFQSFELTREFLDLSAELSKQLGYYPDINFGRGHVSMTIHTEGEASDITDAQLEFARRVNVFAPSNKITQTVLEAA